MAKNLPYFKFEPSEWENGNIQMCSRETKGLFMDLCAIYWSRLGDLPEKLAIQKLCGGNADALIPLYEEKIITVKDGDICIGFLNEQLLEFEDTSNQNRDNALKGWEKRRKEKKGKYDASALIPQSESDAIREEKRREEERREEKMKELFERFWNDYDKKTSSKEKSFKKFRTLKNEELEKLFQHVPNYVNSTPDKKYRKDPLTYLNNKSFNNEIITSNGQQEQSFTEKFFKGTTDVC